MTRWKWPIFENRYSRNTQISVWNNNFFPRQAIPKIFSVLDSNYHRNTRYQFWFTLNNSLTQWKRPIFKIRYLRNSQISVWRTNFFPRQAIPKFFSVLDSSYPWSTRYQVWFILNNSLIRWKRPFFKIRCLRNSQISVWRTNFFPRQAIPKFFSVLDSSYPWNTRYQVWFILNNSLTRWKRPIFKYTYSKLFGNKRKIPYEKVTFFLGKLYQKFLLFYTLSRPNVLHTGFGWIWITPWPDENDLFLKIVIREKRKFPYEIITFFLGKLYQNFFLF